jgi:uncharacterized protein (TIGR02001 family)
MTVSHAGPLLVAALVAIGAALAPRAEAQTTANVGLVGNYVWRGVTQTDDGPAVQGGLDYAGRSGFVAGAWLSNVRFVSLVEGNETTLDPTVEIDLYSGYQGSAGRYSYKGLFTAYVYPSGGEIDFLEVGASGRYTAADGVSLGLSLNYTLWGEAGEGLPFRAGDLYAQANAGFSLPGGFGLGVTGAYYAFADAGIAYPWAGLAVTKDAGAWGTFGLNASQAWGDVEALTISGPRDLKVWVSWVKTFETPKPE